MLHIQVTFSGNSGSLFWASDTESSSSHLSDSWSKGMLGLKSTPSPPHSRTRAWLRLLPPGFAQITTSWTASQQGRDQTEFFCDLALEVSDATTFPLCSWEALRFASMRTKRMHAAQIAPTGVLKKILALDPYGVEEKGASEFPFFEVWPADMGGVVSSTRSSRIIGWFSMVFWSLVILKESFTTYHALLRNRKWEHKLVAFFSVDNGHWVCEWVPVLCSHQDGGFRSLLRMWWLWLAVCKWDSIQISKFSLMLPLTFSNSTLNLDQEAGCLHQEVTLAFPKMATTCILGCHFSEP